MGGFFVPGKPVKQKHEWSYLCCMMEKKMTWNDTIVAIATAPGAAAIAVIRLSGNEAINIANNLFTHKDLMVQPSHSLHVGLLQHKNTIIDEVVVSLYKGNKSYTGEPVVEISCHGNARIQQDIVHACIAQGARLANPGEFTQRAFLNGKLDLAQAEAVADLIASDTEAARQTALNQLRGGFSKDLKQLREQLIHFAALIALELDFAEEDVEFADRTQFIKLINDLKRETTSLLNSFALGNVIKNGVQVAIIGKPNAGKSTLLNALLNEERAIVSEIAGTTRDTIEEAVNIHGILFRFVDTAGIRSHTSDVIEQLGIQKTFEKIKSAGIIIYLADGQTETPEHLHIALQDLQTTAKVLVVLNKADLLDEQGLQSWQQAKEQIPYPFLLLSLKEKKNNASPLDELCRVLYNQVATEEIRPDASIVTNARHQLALQKMNESLLVIEAGLQQQLSGDLLTPDIRRCLYYLGEITGEVEIDKDILGTIFSKFCIGK